MKTLTFFTETAWAFGVIHHALSRLLWNQGWDCEVLDFFARYDPGEFQRIDQHTQRWVTTPPGAVWLLNYGVSASKILAVAHSQWDILLAQKRMGLNFQSLAGYAVVNSDLVPRSRSWGVEPVPEVVTVGLIAERFHQPVVSRVRRLGYAAAWRSENFWGQEIKRGDLAAELAGQAGMELVTCARQHYLAMPAFYQGVDALIQTSLEEGVGLPALEASASGRMVLGTGVGYLPELLDLPELRSWILPQAASDLLSQACQEIADMRQHPTELIRRTQLLQARVRAKYHWKQVLPQWLAWINNS